MEPTSTTAKTDRVVRVFISSTFRDMHAEREELVKFTFPELRRRCQVRQVEFVGVDLRWGIPDERKADGKVLPICLEEIKRCHPFFIGLLGERYGWVPEEIDQELLTQDWLKDHRDHSITALEIYYGVLKDPDMKRLAYFYFRDAQKSEEIEKELAKEPDYTPEPKAFRQKLQNLKEKIRQSGYAIREGYSDARTCGQMVLEDLWEAIDKRFPLPEVPNAIEQDRLGHEAFASARRKIYMERKAYYKRLTQHIQGEGPPLIILGDSGSGKSALIANWAKQYQEEHPDDFIVIHFIGSTVDSADYTRIIRRIMEEIKERYEIKGKESDLSVAPFSKGGMAGFSEEIPADPRKLVEQLPSWLARTTGKGRFIIILDALNQLEDRDNAPDLGWLPEYFPPNIRVILSTLPGRSLTALEKRNWPALGIEPLSFDEKRVFIVDYLKQYTKELSPPHIEQIARSGQTCNPLFLRTLLEELRIYGDYPTLSQKIAFYLLSETVDDLYGKILERWEKDYERDHPGLVRQTMSLLWAARRGLSEIELLELLGSDAKPLQRAYWSPLYLAAEESLVSRSGVLNFFHDFLRKAVEDRYLSGPYRQKVAHLRLADYFETKEIDDRKVDELPWQLREAANWKRLKDCVTDIPILLSFMTETRKYELTGYWLALGSRFDMVEAYNASLALHEETKPSDENLAHILNAVGLFLNLNARHDGAEPFYRRALVIWEKVRGPEHPNTASSFNNLACLLGDKGDYDGADPLYRQALGIREKVLGPEHPDTAESINNLALLLYSKGDYDGAEPLYRRALSIYEKALGPGHPDTAISLNNLAFLLYSKGDYEGAEPLFRRALGIWEKALGPGHPDTAISLNNLAQLLDSKGDYDGADPLYRRALSIREKALGPEHPNTAQSINDLALLLNHKGDYEGAEPLYRRGLGIYQKALGPEHPNTAASINNLALLLNHKGDYEGAEPLYRRALSIWEKALGPEHPNTAASINNLALLLKRKGDYEGAKPFYRKALSIYEKVLGPEHPDTATSLNNLAELLHSKGDYEGAESFCRKALGIREKVLGPEHPDTASSLDNLACLLEHKGDYDGAEPLYRRALAIREKVLGSDHPDTAQSLNNFAGLLRARGDHDAAEHFYRRALAIHEEVLGPEQPNTATSLNNLALLLYSKRDYEGAEPFYQRALSIREKVLGPEHPDTAASLNNLAELLRSKGDYEGAEPFYRRALSIWEKVLGPEHPDTATSLNNLALLLHSKGDYEGAEPFYQRALSIREKVLGPEHPDTAASLNNLAELLRSKGDYEGAEPFYQRALSIREKVLGPEHPDTAGSLNNLAALLYSKGDYEGAEPLYRRALSIWEKVLGPEHPDTAGSLNNLAALLYSKGDYEGAEPLYRRTLSIYEKVLGPEHPDTANSLNNLAALLYNKGDYHGAEPLCRRALSIREKVLGPGHPYIITTANNLFSLSLMLRDKGDHQKAAELYRHLLTTYENVLEKTPVNISEILGNMAICHNELAFHTEVPAKNWKEAESHYRQGIDLFIKAPKPLEAANVELNLQTLFRLSGQQVDLARVKKLTRILEEAGDKRAEKGHKLLEELRSQ